MSRNRSKILPPYIQEWKGSLRVRVRVPPECRANLPAPHTNKSELVKALKTTNPCQAAKFGAPFIGDFLRLIEAARPVPEIPMVWQTYLAPARIGDFGYPSARIARRLVPADAEAPMIDVSPVAVPIAAVSFESVVESWATERQPTAESVDNSRMIFRQFAAFTGHSDAVKVTADDAAAYKGRNIDRMGSG